MISALLNEAYLCPSLAYNYYYLPTNKLSPARPLLPTIITVELAILRLEPLDVLRRPANI